MPLKLRPPPVDHDISRQFEPVDRRNIGGNGCFNAGVFVVRHKRSGKKYVEKKISPQSIDDGTAEFEMFVLRELPHPNIVKYIHGFIDEHGPVSKASMYLEYCDRGNLHDYVENLRGPLDEDKVWDLFMQFVNAVAFMQYGVLDACMDTGVPRDWIGVVHRDIKPDNAFLCSTPGSSRLRLVLGDFGQAIREDDDGNWGRQYLNGNLMTTPPEVERHGFSEYSYSSDVWALGWCIAFVCVRKSKHGMVMHYRAAGGIYSKSMHRAVRRLMQSDPEKRPCLFEFARYMPVWREEGLSEGYPMMGR